MKRILVAMSGGVDSAVSVLLLQKQGYEVAGATMLLQPHGKEEAEAARRSAEALGIDFYVFDWQEEFRREVIAPFRKVYQQGGTPNPCIFCNKALKFGAFLDRALEMGFDGIATGHYARICQNGTDYEVSVARDPGKDQTYMLYQLTPQQLPHILFPMGDYTKEEARAMAKEAGLPPAGKQDSQDICFIPDGDYLSFLIGEGVTPQPGHFIGPEGEDLGPHRGMEAYTIGQRRGLDVAYGSRIYVTKKEAANVHLGPNEALFSSEVSLSSVNYLTAPPAVPFRAQVKLRYTAKPAPCTVTPTGSGASLLFDAPQRAVTPGQAAVIYDGDRLLGGGTIL